MPTPRTASVFVWLAACAPAPAIPPPLPPTPAAIPDAAAEPAELRPLIEAALVAKGGRARLAAMRTISWAGTGKETESGGGEREVRFRRLVVLPDKQSIATTTRSHSGDTGSWNEVVLGDRGWIRVTSDQFLVGKEPPTRELASDDVADVQHQLWTDLDLVLLHAADPASKLHAAPDAIVNGQPCHVVMLGDPGGKPVGLYLEIATSHLVRVTYVERGAPWTADASAFDTDDGIVFAHHRKLVGPDDQLELDFDTIEADGPYNAGALVPPP